jgi:hypothetical protein
MVLEVHPLTASDMPTLVTIQMAAFSTGVVTKLFPTNSPTYIPTTIAKHLKSMTEEPDVRYLKVIDTELNGQIIACAKWRINLAERGQEEVEKMLPQPGKEEEGNEAAKAFMAYLRWARSTYMGSKPFYCMSSLPSAFYPPAPVVLISRFVYSSYISTNTAWELKLNRPSPPYAHNRSRTPPPRCGRFAPKMGN